MVITSDALQALEALAFGHLFAASRSGNMVDPYLVAELIAADLLHSDGRQPTALGLVVLTDMCRS